MADGLRHNLHSINEIKMFKEVVTQTKIMAKSAIILVKKCLHMVVVNIMATNETQTYFNYD